jgi:hypothetical protein
MSNSPRGATAAHRSELAALNTADVDEGLQVVISPSKTDAQAVGRTVAVPYGSNPATCPPLARRASIRPGTAGVHPSRTACGRRTAREAEQDQCGMAARARSMVPGALPRWPKWLAHSASVAEVAGRAVRPVVHQAVKRFQSPT